MVADFADTYGIRLHREEPSWVEFRDLLVGLLATDRSRLWQHFRQDAPPTDDDEEEGP